MSFVDVAISSVFKLKPGFAIYLTKLGNEGNLLHTLLLKLKARKWEGYTAFFFFFSPFRAEIRTCSFGFFRGKEFGLARNQLSWGCERDPVLDSCCESRSGYYLASLILKPFWSFFWVLSNDSTLRTFTLEPEIWLQENLSLINFSINRSNYRLTYLMGWGVLWNAGPMNLMFPFRLVTHAPSNAFHVQETPPTNAFGDSPFFPFLF